MYSTSWNRDFSLIDSDSLMRGFYRGTVLLWGHEQTTHTHLYPNLVSPIFSRTDPSRNDRHLPKGGTTVAEPALPTGIHLGFHMAVYGAMAVPSPAGH